MTRVPNIGIASSLCNANNDRSVLVFSQVVDVFNIWRHLEGLISEGLRHQQIEGNVIYD